MTRKQVWLVETGVAGDDGYLCLTKAEAEHHAQICRMNGEQCQVVRFIRAPAQKEPRR